MKNYKNFISFEGIDFSGKGTQIQILMKRLKSVNVYPTLLREPGGTVISEKIRDILLSPDHEEMIERTEILLYEAARSQLVHQLIIPLLKKDKYVIADRYYDSTTAYQGYGRQLDLDVVQILNNFATSSLKPYKTFFIDISPAEAEQRRIENEQPQDRLESGGEALYNEVRRGFLTLCSSEPNRFVRLDGERPQEAIANDIWEIIKIIWEIDN
jgi:dTMP kinase